MTAVTPLQRVRRMPRDPSWPNQPPDWVRIAGGRGGDETQPGSPVGSGLLTPSWACLSTGIPHNFKGLAALRQLAAAWYQASFIKIPKSQDSVVLTGESREVGASGTGKENDGLQMCGAGCFG